MRGVDVVHHNVALVPLTKSGGKFWEVNVTGSRIAAEEAVKAGVKGFIHMSSSALFGTLREGLEHLIAHAGTASPAPPQPRLRPVGVRARRAGALPPRGHAGRTEAFFDDPQIQVNGPSFEGAAMNYEGHLALSRQVLLVGPFVADQILGATSATKESPASDQPGKDVNRRLPELLEANRSFYTLAWWRGF